MRTYPVQFIIFLIIVSISESYTQDLGNLREKNPIKISGGFSTNQILYFTNGDQGRRDPYNYFFSGNLNFALFGWSIPLVFTYSNQSFSLNQPFNQFSLSPKYKWINLHAGFNSMNFSSYTLSGHIFLGGGVDLSPNEHWKISAMYGRLKKAIMSDVDSGNIEPSFKRMGYGIKTSWIGDNKELNFILFRAEDFENSIDNWKDLGISPRENLVLSLAGSIALGTHLKLSVEYAGSAFTEDVLAEDGYPEKIFSQLQPVYTGNMSSSFYNAFKMGFNYTVGLYKLGIQYERVDPGYKTLGGYYFNNDFKNLTLNFGANLLDNKLNLNFSGGSQNNNLQDQNVNNNRNLVGSIDFSITPSQRFNLNGNFSNFRNFTNIRPQFEEINDLTSYDHMDTLNFVQVSTNAGLSMGYAVSTSEERQQRLHMSVSHQRSAEQQLEGSDPRSSYWNLNTSWSITLKDPGLTLTAALNAARQSADSLHTTTLGPTASANSTWLRKRMQSSFAVSVNRSRREGTAANRSLNLRISNRYKLREKHKVSLNLVALNRIMMSGNVWEFTAAAGYSWRF